MGEQIIEVAEPYISGAAKAEVSQMHRLNAKAGRHENSRIELHVQSRNAFSALR